MLPVLSRLPLIEQRFNEILLQRFLKGFLAPTLWSKAGAPFNLFALLAS